MNSPITFDDEPQSVAWCQSLAFRVAYRPSAVLVLATIGMTAVAYRVARSTLCNEVRQRLRTAIVDRQRTIAAYVIKQHERAARVASRIRLRQSVYTDSFSHAQSRSDVVDHLGTHFEPSIGAPQ